MNEVVNPLKSIHKVAAFYFTIGNLEPKYKSQLRQIHLCPLIQHQLFQRYPPSIFGLSITYSLNSIRKFLTYVSFTKEPTSSFPTIIFHDAGNPLLAVKASIKIEGVAITSGEMDVLQALQYLLEVYFLFHVE